MFRLVLRNLSFMLKSKANVVKAFEQAVAGEFVDFELRAESLVIANAAAFEINRKLIPGGIGLTREFYHFVFG